jgi:hypothetical protein
LNELPSSAFAATAPQQDERLRLHDVELRLQPRLARIDLEALRRLVDSPLPALLELEVLHDVRQIGVAALDAGGL